MVENEAAAAALGSIFPLCRIGYAHLEEIFIENGPGDRAGCITFMVTGGNLWARLLIHVVKDREH